MVGLEREYQMLADRWMQAGVSKRVFQVRKKNLTMEKPS